MDPLTNEDVADILALLDSLPYDEFDLETPRFRLALRRTPAGWTQSTQILSAPKPLAAPEGATSGVRGPLPPSIGGGGPLTPVVRDGSGTEDASVAGGAKGDAGVGTGGVGGRGGGGGDGGHEDAGLVAVRAPLPGTFYR